MRLISSGKRFVPVCFAVVFGIGCGGGSGGGASLAAPSNLTAGPLGGGAHLTWKDNSDDEDTFLVERKEAPGVFVELDSVPFDTTLYHDAAVNLGHRYTYRIRAKRGATDSAYSNEATADLSVGGAGGATGAGGEGGTATGMGGSAGGNMTGSGGAGGASSGQAGTGGQAGATGAGGTGSPDAGSDASSDTRPPQDGPAAVVSFRRDVVPSLVQSCGSTTSGCHNRDQAVGRIMPQFGPCKVIWFSSADEPEGATYYSGANAGQRTGCPDLGLYDRLTQLHSMLCDSPTWQQRPMYVVPGDAQRSLLYQVIAGDPSYGGRCSANGLPVSKMPKVDPTILPNGVPLTQDKIFKIRDWILQGAANN
jgi:hypothetical protein